MPQKERFSSQRVLTTYVDDMITAKMGSDIDQRKREELRRELLEQLEDMIQRGVVEALSDAKLMELDQLLERDASDEEVERFFETSGVDYQEMALEKAKQFRDQYLGVTNEAGAQAQAVQPVQVEVGQVQAEAAPTQPQVAQPVQGTTSEVAGKSDVEGVALGGSASEGVVPGSATSQGAVLNQEEK